MYVFDISFDGFNGKHYMYKLLYFVQVLTEFWVYNCLNGYRDRSDKNVCGGGGIPVNVR